ncbi:muskelin isoform X1 [Neodiprion lecontei]|uniref:Muskelin isoform X1 n=1 Tax=Neodiprion lecontei TaxID=441921 RepID=A0ABM3GQI5_NEOLC|nr:muskelin isoform X1 [Neodiprion fabricii]XP_046602532.1 muskelin isoform X1 [Neodiprion lecontei]
MAACESEDFHKVLEYRIFKCSSYSSTYVPENILVDVPSDQSSRWSSDNDNHPQFLILKLQHQSIVKTITFGKYEKTHVCNIKKFKVFGGLEPENMMELLESGLKNDSTPETFDLKHVVGNDENYFPIKYLKILPLQSWGPSFNFSIWHVHLAGVDDQKLVKSSIECFNSQVRQQHNTNVFIPLNKYRQKEVLRLCMKHFRRLEYPEIVNTLQRVTGVSLEDSRLSTLYDILVTKGDHCQAERFISNAVNMGLFNEYINAQAYRAIWTKIFSKDPKPGMRGGHQMVLDPSAEMLYLFGGWDGNQDLADLWTYNVSTDKWHLICKDTEAVGGPTARSCHKMCLDPERRQLFTLGRYLDTQYRSPENLKSDFYVYDIESDKWTQISEDTGAVGGPQLIFDHQMSMDVAKRTIYIFGGRVLVPSHVIEDNHGVTPNVTEPVFSGLYSYHVPTGTWSRLACDIARPSPPNIPTIRSRVGHSMLFHPEFRKLYIFAGQRSKEYLNDFFTFEVDTETLEHINLSDLGNRDSNHVPAAGFTQRATIDPELGEIYVLSGLSKDKEKRDDNVQNSLWVYNIKENRWSCIYRNENVGDKYWNSMQDYEPCPRFAHQLVYDHIQKVHYLFGGNPGRSCLPKLRLDDFWQLELCRPSHEQILRKCKLIIRKHKFEELAMKNSIEALEYLQTQVYEIIDHADPEQTKEFQLLASVLFREQERSMDNSLDLDPASSTSSSDRINSVVPKNFTMHDIHARRTELFDKLTEFFPESLTQPRANLIDLLPL